MQGLGDIIRANIRAGNQGAKQRSGTGSVGRNGEGSPWRIERVNADLFLLVRRSDAYVCGEFTKLRAARKSVAKLILEGAQP